jgi:hypothetical protein
VQPHRHKAAYRISGSRVLRDPRWSSRSFTQGYRGAEYRADAFVAGWGRVSETIFAQHIDTGGALAKVVRPQVSSRPLVPPASGTILRPREPRLVKCSDRFRRDCSNWIIRRDPASALSLQDGPSLARPCSCVRRWPTSADLRVAQGRSASWGSPDVPLMLSAQPFREPELPSRLRPRVGAMSEAHCAAWQA